MAIGQYPSPDPTQGIDPNVFKRLQRGFSATARQPAIQDQIAEARALRDKEIAPVQEGVAVSPGALLANLFGSNRGRKDLAAAQAEATALRGDIADAEGAKFDAGLQQKAYGEQRAIDQMMNEREYQAGLLSAKNRREDQNIAAQRAEAERIRLANQDYKSTAQTGQVEEWVWPDGREVKTRYTDKGAVDQYTGEKVDLSEAKNKATLLREKEIDAKAKGKKGVIGVGTKKKVSGSLLMVDLVNDVTHDARKLTQGDIKTLSDNPTLTRNIMDMTPERFHNWMRDEGLELSPSARNFMEKVHRIATEERHEKFGSAFTAMEKQLSDMFSAGADGLTVDQVLQRLDHVKGMAFTNIRSVDDVEGTDFGTLRPGYAPWFESAKAKEQQLFMEKQSGNQQQYDNRNNSGAATFRALPLPANPPGTADQWNALSPEQQTKYYQSKGLALPEGQ